MSHQMHLTDENWQQLDFIWQVKYIWITEEPRGPLRHTEAALRQKWLICRITGAVWSGKVPEYLLISHRANLLLTLETNVILLALALNTIRSIGEGLCASSENGSSSEKLYSKGYVGVSIWSVLLHLVVCAPVLVKVFRDLKRTLPTFAAQEANLKTADVSKVGNLTNHLLVTGVDSEFVCCSQPLWQYPSILLEGILNF